MADRCRMVLEDEFAEGLSRRAVGAIHDVLARKFHYDDTDGIETMRRMDIGMRLNAKNVASLDYRDFLITPNCGPRTIAEVRAKLATCGLDLQNVPKDNPVTHCPTCGRGIDGKANPAVKAR